MKERALFLIHTMKVGTAFERYVAYTELQNLVHNETIRFLNDYDYKIKFLISPLIELLGERDTMDEAEELLGMIGPVSELEVEEVLAYLKSGNPVVLKGALKSLRNRGGFTKGEEVFKKVLPLLSHPSIIVRNYATEVLLCILSKYLNHDFNFILPTLYATLDLVREKVDKDERHYLGECKANTIALLGRFLNDENEKRNEIYDKLIYLLSHDSYEVKNQCLRQLSYFKPTKREYFEALRQLLLKDPDEEIRNYIVEVNITESTIIELYSTEVISTLEKAHKSEQSDKLKRAIKFNLNCLKEGSEMG